MHLLFLNCVCFYVWLQVSQHIHVDCISPYFCIFIYSLNYLGMFLDGHQHLDGDFDRFLTEHINVLEVFWRDPPARLDSGHLCNQIIVCLK